MLNYSIFLYLKFICQHKFFFIEDLKNLLIQGVVELPPSHTHILNYPLVWYKWII